MKYTVTFYFTIHGKTCFAEGEIREFDRSVSLLENKFGLVLLQLAPQTPYNPDRLYKALTTFNNPARVAVEFRHEQWFTDEIAALLRETGATFCSVDSPKIGLMDLVTSENAYIRMHGRSGWYNADYSDQQLQEVCELCNTMAAQGAKRIYNYFNNDFGGFAPKNALRLKEMLGVA